MSWKQKERFSTAVGTALENGNETRTEIETGIENESMNNRHK